MTNTGADTLLRTLVGAGITTCFANPGTSEIHVVAALDVVREMQTVLTLFEGVATGAADGYARMTRSPAATLLHLGPGLSNGLANLHNARRAGVPLVNVVGDHATHHVPFDTPLQSDIETIARNVSAWVRTSRAAEALPRDAADAVGAAIVSPGQIATLIVPADLSWQEGSPPGPPPRQPTAPRVAPEVIAALADVVRGTPPAGILLGGHALSEPGLLAAARVAAATGAKLFAERHAARIERGAGRPTVERLAYWPELVRAQLEGLEHLVLAGARAPVSLFAYPGQESSLVPEGCDVHELATAASDAVGALIGLSEALGADHAAPVLQPPSVPPRPTGGLTAAKVCQAIAAVLPEGAIISDEAVTSAATLPTSTVGAPPHDWLTLTGGAIGQGLPVAVGAAIACPDRPVIALEADGSALYTIQSLWTMAREQLDVTVVIFNNRSYAILGTEFDRLNVGAAGPVAASLLDLSRPALDFVALGNGFGVPSQRSDDAESFTVMLERAIAEPGPHLIEALLSPA